MDAQNHDNQVNITHLEEIEREQRIAPLSYTRTAPAGVGGTEGPGNYWVPVRGHLKKILFKHKLGRHLLRYTNTSGIALPFSFSGSLTRAVWTPHKLCFSSKTSE